MFLYWTNGANRTDSNGVLIYIRWKAERAATLKNDMGPQIVLKIHKSAFNLSTERLL